MCSRARWKSHSGGVEHLEHRMKDDLSRSITFHRGTPFHRVETRETVYHGLCNEYASSFID
jgi:hypothetical protein